MAETTITELLEKLAERDRVIEAKDKEIALLHQKVDMLSRMIYGTKSEAFNPNQPDLFGVVAF